MSARSSAEGPGRAGQGRAEQDRPGPPPLTAVTAGGGARARRARVRVRVRLRERARLRGGARARLAEGEPARPRLSRQRGLASASSLTCPNWNTILAAQGAGYRKPRFSWQGNFLTAGRCREARRVPPNPPPPPPPRPGRACAAVPRSGRGRGRRERPSLPRSPLKASPAGAGIWFAFGGPRVELAPSAVGGICCVLGIAVKLHCPGEPSVHCVPCQEFDWYQYFCLGKGIVFLLYLKANRTETRRRFGSLCERGCCWAVFLSRSPAAPQACGNTGGLQRHLAFKLCKKPHQEPGED